MCPALPDPYTDLRFRLSAYEQKSYSGKDVFSEIAEIRVWFYELTWETPETFRTRRS